MEKRHLCGGRWIITGANSPPTARATKQSPVSSGIGSTDQDGTGRNCSAFEDLLLLLTPAFPSFLSSPNIGPAFYICAAVSLPNCCEE